MRKHTWWERLIAVYCTLAIMLSCPFAPVSAVAETGTKVTATTNTSVKQGNSAYCYVYIDSLESLSTLEVTVHFDPAVVSVTGSYNQVSALLYDSSSTESTLQYTYIFDGNGANTQTQLFYFQYTVLPTAPTGDTYFDVVVGDAYDESFEILPVSGSRCAFEVTQAVTDLACSVSGTSAVNTAVNQEFTLTYQFSTASIASGAAVIRYDPELFALAELEQGGFLENKLTDINTSLSGAVYVSFLGTEYSSETQFLTLRFKTLQNVSRTDTITLVLSDLYDLDLNSIACSGYTTSVRVVHDSAVDETAPSVYLQNDYDAQTQTLSVHVCLEENSHLGAGDFVLQFDTARLAYVSAEKGYSPTFFNINDKNIDEGLLKFSVISMTDQTEAVTMLTATFEVITPCEDTATQLVISGSGLADHLTNSIVLNFTGSTAVTAGHTPVTDAYVAPTCLETGLTEGNHCDVCQKVLLAQQIIPALGHDEIPHEAQAPTCTEIGWEAYVTCSRCDYTTYVEIPANGHRFHRSVCTVCGADQEAGHSWDISAAADGSLTAWLYTNHDGTYDLQITGSGAMLEFGYDSAVPWYGYRAQITSLRLPEGLTTIGSYAFYGCSALTELTLPESLQTIGNRAFYECTGLTQIRFNAVQMADLSNKNFVFAYCGTAGEGITVTIGSNVTRIPAYLFHPRNGTGYTPKLTAVEFAQGSSCQSIGSYAFYGAGLTQLTLPEGLLTIEAAAFHSATGLTQLTLPESLTAIGNRAFFECKGLTALTLPENIQTIGDSAFYGCTGLTQLYFNATQMPDLKQSNSVFIYCGNATEGITVSVGSNVTRIPAYLFYPHSSTSYAPKIKAVTFAPDSVCQSIGKHAFRNGAWLTELTLPESLQTIESYAFYDCTGLQTINFSEGLQTIESYAFYDCAGLTGLALPQSLQTIGHYAFYGCTGLQTINLPEGLQTLNSNAFNGCTGLTRIDFNATQLAELPSGNYIFANCGTAGEGITVDVGSNVTRIPAYLFYPDGDTTYSPKLLRVTFAPDSSCQSIGEYAFCGCAGLTELALPAGLQTIESYAFYGCTGLTELTLPEGLQTIESYAFYGCTGLTELTLPEGLQTIEDYAFCDCTGLTELALPEGLQTIEDYAFYNCTGLTELTLPESLQSIGEYAFYNCTGLTRIRFDATQMQDLSAYNYVFAYCGTAGAGITVTVGSQVERIPAYLFCPYEGSGQAPKIVEVEFAQSSTCQSIGYCAFYQCADLSHVVIPAGVTAIERYAFYNCPGTVIAFEADTLPATLENNWHSSEATYYLNVRQIAVVEDFLYVIHNDDTAVLARYDGAAATYQVRETVEDAAVIAIGANAFRDNAVIEQVDIPDSVTTIGAYAFYGCAAIKRITIPENITRIGQYAFYNCTGVEEIVFHAVAMEDLAYQNFVFYQNGMNTEGIAVTIGSGVTKIPAYLFRSAHDDKYNPKITSITFAENGVCQSIGHCSFYGLDHLTTIIIPETVTSIDGNAISYCAKLTIGFEGAALPETLGSYWHSNSGYYLNVQEFVIQQDATYVITKDNTAVLGRYFGTAARYNILEEVNGVAVTGIGDCAFYTNKTLESIAIPDSITAIGELAIAHCTALTDITIPGSVVSIGKQAFYYCSSLPAILIPESVTSIGMSAFYYCDKLTIGLAAEGLPTTLGNSWNGTSGYFCNVREFKQLADALYVIKNDDTAALGRYFGTATQYDILESVDGAVTTAISRRAFLNATTLVNVTIPETVTEIGQEAFYNCYGLTAVQLPSGLEKIEEYTFYNCYGLTEMSLPEGITTIGSYAFHGCTGMTALHLPQALTTIGSRAFYNCKNLTQLRIPAQVTDIGSRAFQYTGIKLVYICSQYVASNLSSASAYGYLLSGASTVNIRADIGAVNSYITQNYPDTTPITYQGVDYISYSANAHNWSEYEVLAQYIICQQDGCIRYYCADCGAFKDVTTPCHDVITHEAQAPDCENVGWYAYETCSRCDYTTYVEIPALGHWIEDIGKENDPTWPFLEEDGIYTSTNKTDSTTSIFTITATRECALTLFGKVSSEAGYDRLIILHNGNGIADLSGEYDWQQYTLTLRAGDVVTVSYRKDGSAVSGQDTAWFYYQLGEGGRIPGEQGEPTCTEAVICSVCGKTLKEALGHDEILHEAQAATCLAIGWDAYHTCSRCDYTTYVELPALGHDLQSHEAQAPTCTEIGWDAYDTCSRCDYTTYVELPALGHDLIGHEAQVPDCENVGWEAYDTCSRCDYTTCVEIPALGHDSISHEAREVTCLEIGWDAYETCSRCDHTTYVEIPALGHDLQSHEAQPVSCLAIGWDAYDTCSRCDYTTYVEIPATGHWIVDIEEENDPTWPFQEEDGIYCSTNKTDSTTSIFTITATRECALTLFGKVSSESGCDRLIIRHNGNGIAELSGEWDWQEYTLSLQADDVVTVRYQKDGSVANGQDTAWFYYQLEEGGRIPGEQGEPTCTEAVICSLCGELLKQALGHDPISHEAQAPTCTEIGWDAYETCSRCDYSTYAEIPANGHSFVQTICTVCGQKQEALKTWDISADGSGSLMARIYRNFVDDGYELEITGSGPMADYNYYTYAPWYYSYGSLINRVTLPEGLTTIGDMAFYQLNALRQIRIPDSVESIGNDAFAYSEKLTILLDGDTMPANLEYGWHRGCSYYLAPRAVIQDADATYVIDRDGNACLAKYIGNGAEFVARETVDGIPVTKIGDYAFYRRNTLQIHWIPREICAIGENAFAEANGTILLLESSTLPETLGSNWNGGCPYYLAPLRVWEEDGFLFLLDQQENLHLIRYVGDGPQVSVPSQVDGYALESIETYAFAQTDVEAVVLPEGLRSVPANCFDQCYQLREVTLPDTLETIGYEAFAYCTALQALSLPEGLTSIGGYALRDCSSLQQLTLPDSLTSLGNDVFWGCGALTSMVIPESITALDGTFVNCYNLESVTLHDGITRLGGMTFYGCHSLKTLQLPKALQSFGYYTFYCCYDLKVLDLPENLHNVEWNTAFMSTTLDVLQIRSSLLAASLTESVAGNALFQNLKTVVVPAGTGTEYLQSEYPYLETAQWDGADYDIYSREAHSWQEEVISEYVVCQNDGQSRFICGHCGLVKEQFTPAHDIVCYDAKAETCTEAGWEAYEACSRCDYSTYVELPALGHASIHHEAQAPTCLEIGWDAYETCSRCDHTTYVELPALGHDAIHHEAQAPACLEIGWNAYETCSRCDHTTYVELPALGHAISHHEAQAPTCTDIGWEAYEACSRCDYSTIRVIPATGQHTFDGDSDTLCDVCGLEFIWFRFDTNGGTSIAPFRVLPDQTVDLSAYAPERQGYRFAGWSVTRYGEVAYGPDGVVCRDRSVTLYGQWNKLCGTCDGSKIIKVDCESCIDGIAEYETACPYCLGAGLVCVECESVTACTDPQNHGVAFCQKCDDGQCTVTGPCPDCSGTGYKEQTCTDCNEYGETIRADGAAPGKPTVERVDAGTVVLKTIENGEYSLDGVTWQDSPVFTGLAVGTQYSFYQRYVKTDTTLTSDASEPLTMVIKELRAAPEAPVLQDKTDDTVTLVAGAGYEYSLDGITWQSSNVFTGLSAETSYTFYQRLAETDTHYASQASAGLTVETAEQTYALGDVNRDGKITAFDAQLLAEANAGLRTLTQEQWQQVGDLSPADIVDYVLGKR